jgi:hypothetical protein
MSTAARARGWLLAAVLLPGLLHAQAEDDGWSFDFDRNFRTAQANAATSPGAAYDRDLGTYFAMLDALRPRLDRCLARARERTRLWGYFRFARDGDYRVALRPKGALARCISAAFEGHDPPRPESLPYMNPFTYTVEPPE